MCKATTKAILYLRVSSEEQGDSGLGLEAQEAACRQFCARGNFEIVGVYTDAGVSGSVEPANREGLMKALYALKRGYVLLAARRDRLARQVSTLSLLGREVARKKGILLTADDKSCLDSDDPANVAFMQMLDVFSQFERGMIRSRTKAALQAKRSKGQRVSGRAPYGFHIIPNHPDKMLEADPDEQTILMLMRKLRAQGSCYRTVTKKITDEGYLNRNGRPFQHASVHKILTRKPIEALESSPHENEGLENAKQLTEMV